MSDTAPANDHGPAQVQLSPEQAAALGLTPASAGTPAAPLRTVIPADQVKPEDIAKLAIEYREGQPVIVASGGKVIPTTLNVVRGTKGSSFDDWPTVRPSLSPYMVDLSDPEAVAAFSAMPLPPGYVELPDEEDQELNEDEY
ncbi:hypothetical protein [Streptomyces sp. NPDC002855]|uniref:hypothetical protein n=1 Tax=unclassified Streptomyces TaxID=2593676 RepID=UPI00332BDD3F